MIFKEKTIALRNGQSCLLKSPTEDDAGAILIHLKQTSDETRFMARNGNEITMSDEDEKKYLTKIAADPKSIMISAVLNGELAANAGFDPVAPYEKYQHRANFGISIKEKYWHRGIGSAILKEIIQSAKLAHYEQLELEVVTDNERAIALYQKYGFIVYGTREKSFKYRDGSYGCEHLMLLRL